MGKKKNANGLGRQLIKDRFGKKNKPVGDSFLHTSDLKDGYDWGRLNLQSVTEQNNLEEFLSTAELAGTEFAAEKLNIKFVTADKFGGIPQGQDLQKIHGLHREHQKLLRVPRRPPWTKAMSSSQLDQNEREAFLEWRRSLASLQDVEGLVMTPYEKNLDFWRQLWRVIERSDIVVQIVDARNPLLFFCPDLEQYVQEVDKSKVCLLLINKADFLNQSQRDIWASYFSKKGVRIAFWSALEEANRQDKLEGGKKHTVKSDASDDEVDDNEEEEEDVSDGSDSNDEVQERLGQNFEKADEGLNDDDDVGDDDDGFVDKYGQKIAVTKSHEKSAGKSKLDRTEVEKMTVDGKGSGNKAETQGDNMDTDSCDNNKEGDGSDTLTIDVKTLSSPASASKEESMDLSCETQSAAENNSQNADNLCSAMGADSDIQNSGKIYSGEELLDLFRGLHSGIKVQDGITTVGMVGYPNVGKSSTINAILRMKKVPVSATPGRTKHFQTLYVDPQLMLCDCPGLVFPSFVTTKADLVVSGILPVDQMRDHVPPSSLVCQLIPRPVLEKTYGIIIPPPGEEEDPNRPPTSHELLNAYGAMRGFMTARGVPDCPRSSRYILKDYVNGKLLYCHPPPDVDPVTFNPVQRDFDLGPGGDGAQDQTEGKGQDVLIPSKVDKDFFRPIESSVHLRTARGGIVDSSSAVQSGGLYGSQLSLGGKPWKKHNNRNKKQKLRRVYGYLDS